MKKLIGYSLKINDPAFDEYVKKTNKFIIIFTIIAVVLVNSGFYIASMKSSEISFPEAIFISTLLSIMFIIICLFSIFSRNKNKTFDGEVVSKNIKKKVDTSDENSYSDYLLYIVKIKGDNGKVKKLKYRDNNSMYNYFEVGDKVRYHGLLKTFEKYDKSKDEIIFCNACLTKHSINDEVCSHCKCPLLK
ncbi:MAG: hypothetical protein GX758_04365 [Tenericutes bacterium]|nr:hypothetical protein [Mycoplasmatota bacterium]